MIILELVKLNERDIQVGKNLVISKLKKVDEIKNQIISKLKLSKDIVDSYVKKIILLKGETPNKYAFEVIFGTRKLPFSFVDLDFSTGFDKDIYYKKGFTDKELDMYYKLCNYFGKIDDIALSISKVKKDYRIR